MEADQAVAVVLHFYDLAGHGAALKRERGADLCTLARTCKCFPYVVTAIFQKQKFNVRAGLVFNAVNTRRQNTGIVEYKTIARIQILRDVVKMSVLDLTGCFVQHHQARSVTRFNRRLGDKFFRKLKIKIFCL